MPEPRVLFFDIETAPNLSFVWGHFDQTVIKHVRPWHILCIAWQWKGETDVSALGLCDFPGYDEDPHNDLAISEVLWGLFDEADVVVAHNGDKFDIRKVNSRFLMHGLGRPSPVQSVDTLKILRRSFAFNTNRLDSVGAELEIGRKVKHEGFKLWESCMSGDEGAWDRMKKYNLQDIRLLVELYIRLLPWMDTHPNLALIGDRPWACTKCGGDGPFVARKWKHTRTRSYRQFQCKQCGGYSKSRTSDSELVPPDMS